MITQETTTPPKLLNAKLLGIRFCFAGLLGVGFGIASLISWGQKPASDPNHEPNIGFVIDCFGGLLVGAIYFCASSMAHWFMRKQNSMRIISSDIALFLIGLVYLLLQGFSH